jgi:hypothetical protein
VLPLVLLPPPPPMLPLLLQHHILLPPMQEFTKHEAEVAANKLGHAPQAAVSALGTAGEVISGVAGHVVDKVRSPV